MEKKQLFGAEWLTLSSEVRQKLVEMFGLKRDCSTEVERNAVVCDGYSNTMIANISLEAMNAKGFEGNDFLEVLTKILKSFEPVVEEVVAEEEPVIEKKVIKTLKK